MNQKTALAIIVALFIIFGIVYTSFKSIETNNSVATTTPTDIPQQVSLQGEYVCLPQKETGGPTTLECALGIKTENGIYYAIDAQGEGARNALLTLQTGLKIQLDGTLVPIERISADTWRKYDIGGIISTSDIKRI